jgi:Spy/CpxP family protein refolding chaperone
MNKNLKLVGLLAGIFVTGSVTGALLTTRFGRNWIQQRAVPEQWASHHVRKLAEKLELKEDQVEQLRPIIRRNMEEMGRLRSECVKDTRVVAERMEREIAEKLTPEQKIKFDEYNREKRERMKKHLQRKAEGTPQEGSAPAGSPSPSPTSAPAPRDSGI